MTSSFSGLILAYFAYNLPISCEIVQTKTIVDIEDGSK
jgi:hypothetical protein